MPIRGPVLGIAAHWNFHDKTYESIRKQSIIYIYIIYIYIYIYTATVYRTPLFCRHPIGHSPYPMLNDPHQLDPRHNRSPCLAPNYRPCQIGMIIAERLIKSLADYNRRRWNLNSMLITVWFVAMEFESNIAMDHSLLNTESFRYRDEMYYWKKYVPDWFIFLLNSLNPGDAYMC